MNTIAVNIAQIRERIDQACLRSGRNPAEVHLIAVSKVKPAQLVEAAFAAGQQLFGENYVQEFCDKAEQVEAPVSWHFIGALQTNKVKYLRGKVEMIHSVDRLALAQEIDKQWRKLGKFVDILIQVNLGDESSKSGCSPDKSVQLAKDISNLENIRIKGLMCLPPFSAEPEEVRPWFRQLRQLRDELAALKLPKVEMKELSMGMSGDFEVAVEEGATLVRVGTAIFGERNKRI